MNSIRVTLLASIACAVSACGGGGAGGPQSTPPPATTPTPTPTPTAAAVTIFATPSPGEYASVGVSTTNSLTSASSTITSVSSADADQVHIRYNAGGFYEIQIPGKQWDRLVHYKGLANADSSNHYLQPAGVAQNFGYFLITKSRDAGYSYSELASWGNLNLSAEGGFGIVAFGTPTPTGMVPATGSASYLGVVAGTADIMQPDNLIGGYAPVGIDGSVALNFDFAAGTLAGTMTISANLGMNPDPLGTFTFKDTIFSPGSTTYSGKFQTGATGLNFFQGRFTGPAAKETIGTWAMPFIYAADGKSHQAIGAWIAKRN